MHFKVRCELAYQLNEFPATFLFALKCIETGGQQILREDLVIDPPLPAEEFTIGSGMNRFSRIRTTGPGPLSVIYEAEVDASVRIAGADTLVPDGPGNLSPEAIPFLFPSRYCPSDKARDQAGELFGHLDGPHAIAAAVSDWIFENIDYVSGSSGETSSALDTLRDRKGVCRDSAILMLETRRALGDPARFVSGHLEGANSRAGDSGGSGIQSSLRVSITTRRLPPPGRNG